LEGRGGMKPIDPGELRHPITIEEATEGDPDASGETTKTWSEVLSCWARIEPTWGREYERAMQVDPEMTLMISIRYSPEVTVTPAMRVVFGTRNLHVLSVRNVEERNVLLQLSCKEMK
jgi:SPP1 family predicted phage head-tail adaptor